MKKQGKEIKRAETAQSPVTISNCQFGGGLSAETATALAELAKAAQENAAAIAATAEAFGRVGSLGVGVQITARPMD